MERREEEETWHFLITVRVSDARPSAYQRTVSRILAPSPASPCCSVSQARKLRLKEILQ